VQLQAIDIFCGAGGASQGLKGAGFRVIAGVENDPRAATTYRQNHPETHLVEDDIRRVRPTHVMKQVGLSSGELTLLKSCPPCQPFSSLSRRSQLGSLEFLCDTTLSWVRAFRPRAVLIENVPGVINAPGFAGLWSGLRKSGYSPFSRVLRAELYGIPQTRRRWFGVAFRSDTGAMDADSLFAPPPPSRARRQADAARALAALPPASPSSRDPLHRPRLCPPIVNQRIAAIPPGADRFSLPDDLLLSCHLGLGRNATGPYGRIPCEGPGPTITTRCTTPSSGRFIHPHQDRPITLREAATLQTFPRSYRFSGTRNQIERQIGNAVPIRLIQLLGKRLYAHLRRAF
jgi:DNA (cytosine-5)-methyltransferase 1